jgi:predicted nucleic acid-binding protein
MIFVDTSYFVALMDKNDKWHERVKELSKRIHKEELVTSNLVISECVTLIGSRGGGMAGLALYDSILDNCRVLFVNKEILENAMNFFLDHDGALTLTDATSAALMKANRIKDIVSFSEDSDFDDIKGLHRIF